MRQFAVGGVCILALAIPAGAQAQSVAEFYKGKVLTVTVGYAAGGGYDIYARVLTRHMGRHIPGNPSFIVQNITGAGSVNAANHLADVAPKDGTVFGTFGRGLAMEPLIGTARVRYDATKLTWIGSGANEVSLCSTWHTSQVKTWADALKTDFTAAGEGAGSDPDSFAAMIRNLFGIKIRVVTGYKGTSDTILAMERGEVDGRCGTSWSSLKSIRPQWIKENRLNHLAYMSEVKAPELPDVPLVSDFANARQKQIVRLVLSRQTMGRPFAAPPGIPADRRQALRRAFDATMKDPAFLAEAEKLKMEVSPVTGEELDKLIADLYATPQDVVEETRVALKP